MNGFKKERGKMKYKYKAISLFSGAGGMDIGFENAGIKVIVANEIDKDACATYEVNNPNTHLIKGDLKEKYDEIIKYKDKINIVFGGPPCQGFSVAGKMDPNDERSTLIWNFLEIVNHVKPKAFIMENVKALATLDKWKDTRNKIMTLSQEMGYDCKYIILNSVDYGVPQKRERVFFIGILNQNLDIIDFEKRLSEKKSKPKSIRETISHLGPIGSDSNPNTCTAKVTLAGKPVLRKSPYAGMIFNGTGRPLNLDDVANTLPASMGGNRTPIIDEKLLHGDDKEDWIKIYHENIISGKHTPIYGEAPSRLRRLTINEAMLIQTFPENYEFKGSKTSIYKQIGNAVPCKLAEVIATTVLEELEKEV